jgi:hypothetical protein
VVYFWLFGLHLSWSNRRRCFIGILPLPCRKLHKAAGALSWIHLILMNVGTTAAAGMMMYAGYQGGAAMLPVAIGGKGFDAQQAYSIRAPFAEPIAGSILATLVGVIAGGANFLIA